MYDRIKGAGARFRQWQQRPAVSVTLSIVGGAVLAYAFVCLAEFVRTGSVYYTCVYLAAHWRQLALGAVVLAALIGFFTVLTGRLWIADLIVGGRGLRRRVGQPAKADLPRRPAAAKGAVSGGGCGRDCG